MKGVTLVGLFVCLVGLLCAGYSVRLEGRRSPPVPGQTSSSSSPTIWTPPPPGGCPGWAPRCGKRASTSKTPSPATLARCHRGAFARESAARPPSFGEEDLSDKPEWMRTLNDISSEAAGGIDDRHRKRLNSMLAVEEMLASFVEELEIAGELENTYLFFTLDNGWQGGEHHLPLEKSFPYEESARVSLYVRGPGVSLGSETEKLVLNTDLAPTFAELAGVGFQADGRSLVPLLRGEEAAWRSAVLLEGFGEAFFGPPGFEAVRTEGHKYVEYYTGDRELYDLAADPYESESAHETADAALLREDLQERLEALTDCSGEGCREAEDAP